MKNFYKNVLVVVFAITTLGAIKAQVTAPLDDGGYLIRIKESTGLLDNSGYPGSGNSNVGGWYPQASVWQRWIITELEDGYYKIQSVLVDSAIITVDGFTNDEEANIIQVKYEDSDYQKWEIQEQDNGYFKILSKGSGKAWHVLNNNDPVDPISRNIVQIGSFNTDLQEFEFIPTADSVSSGPYESEEYYVIASECTQMVMTENVQVTDTGNVVQYSFADENSQKWQLVWVEDVTVDDITTKYFRIINYGSGLVMTLADTAKGDGVSVITAPWSEDSDAQKYQMWAIEPVVGIDDTNQVNVFSRMNDGRTIEIKDGPVWNEGQDLVTWFRASNTEDWQRWQRWRVIKITIPEEPNTINKIDSKETSVKIYPNPTNNYLNLSINTGGNIGIANISLMDITGQIFLQKNHMLSTCADEIFIETEALNDGLYFVNVHLPNGELISNKLIIKN